MIPKNALKFLILLIFLSFTFCLGFSNETNKAKQRYNNEKISLEVNKQFDIMYPLNTKIFHLFKGNERISFNQFISLTDDPVLLKNREKVKKIRIAGFTVAGVSGGAMLAFLIPGVVFAVNLTNYGVYDEAYVLTGVGMFISSAASLVVLLTDLVITFSLLYKYKFNEHSVRQAVENYNRKLSRKLGILPDISYNNQNLRFGFSLRL